MKDNDNQVESIIPTMDYFSRNEDKEDPDLATLNLYHLKLDCHHADWIEFQYIYASGQG